MAAFNFAMVVLYLTAVGGLAGDAAGAVSTGVAVFNALVYLR